MTHYTTEQQYEQVKRHPGVTTDLLMIASNGKYLAFGPDRDIISGIVGSTDVPIDSAETAISKIIRAGYTVSICQEIAR